MPGLIELHTDNLERHLEPRPKVGWPHTAAILAHDAELAGTGITTVFDALRVGSIVSRSKSNYGEYARKLADEIIAMRAAGALKISHLLHLRAEICSETLIAELAKFGAGDAIGIVSLMDHTPGQRQFRDITQLRHYMCGKHGFSEAEFEDHVASQKALSAMVAAAHEEPPSPPPTALARCWPAMTTPRRAMSRSRPPMARPLPSFRPRSRRRGLPREGHRGDDGRAQSGAGRLAFGQCRGAGAGGRGLLDIVSSDYVPSALLLAG